MRMVPVKRLRVVLAATVAMIVGVTGVVAACGATASAAPHGAVRGTVTGRLVREGGPIGPGGQQPGNHPVSGQVRFVRRGHHPVRVQVGKSGRFNVRLAAGRYAVAGSSPGLDLPGRKGWHSCSEPMHVTVRAGHVTRITVACIVP